MTLKPTPKILLTGRHCKQIRSIVAINPKFLKLMRISRFIFFECDSRKVKQLLDRRAGEGIGAANLIEGGSGCNLDNLHDETKACYDELMHKMLHIKPDDTREASATDVDSDGART